MQPHRAGGLDYLDYFRPAYCIPAHVFAGVALD